MNVELEHSRQFVQFVVQIPPPRFVPIRVIHGGYPPCLWNLGGFCLFPKFHSIAIFPRLGILGSAVSPLGPVLTRLSHYRA